MFKKLKQKIYMFYYTHIVVPTINLWIVKHTIESNRSVELWQLDKCVRKFSDEEAL